MTPTKQTRIREPRIKTLQIRVSERERTKLLEAWGDETPDDDYSRSFTDWLRTTLLKQTK
jgi:hypothetical protein